MKFLKIISLKIKIYFVWRKIARWEGKDMRYYGLLNGYYDLLDELEKLTNSK